MESAKRLLVMLENEALLNEMAKNTRNRIFIMTDLTEKRPHFDEQSAVENSEEITQTPFVWKEIFIQAGGKQLYSLQLLGLCPLPGSFGYGNKCIGFRPCNHVGFNLYKHRCFS